MRTYPPVPLLALLLGAGILSARPASCGEAGASRIDIEASLEALTAYYSEGFLQERRPLIFQAEVEVRYRLTDHDALTAGVVGGGFGSFHQHQTLAEDESGFIAHWYELSWWAGVFVEVDRLSFDATFEQSTSPSGAYTSLDYVILNMSFDDTGWARNFSLKPWAEFYIETRGSLDDLDPGTALSLGLEPTWDLPRTPIGPITLRAPVGTSLSLGDFFQDESGRDHVYGYTEVGLFADVALRCVPGDATLTVGVTQGLFGAALRGYNGRSTDTVLSVGIGVSF